MNIEFWKKHQKTELSDAEKMLRDSHGAVIDLLHTFTDEALFTKKYYGWTGSTSLASYCISATSSHYVWALKKLRAHRRQLNEILSH